MSFFKKLGSSVVHIAKKTGSGISHTFKKAGKNIAKGLGSLAGGVGGAEIGGAIAGLLGPEAIPVGMLIGGLQGKELGKEGAGVAYKSLEKQRPQGNQQFISQEHFKEQAVKQVCKEDECLFQTANILDNQLELEKMGEDKDRLTLLRNPDHQKRKWICLFSRGLCPPTTPLLDKPFSKV
jgi:phage tail tape-measure protein